MRRRTLMFLAAASAAAIAIPAGGAGAADEHANASAAKQCAAERNADRAAFKATYGDRALRHCIRGDVAETAGEFANAARICRDQRAGDEAGFMAQFGSNLPRGESARGARRNAFGKCVSQIAKSLHGEEPSA